MYIDSTANVKGMLTTNRKLIDSTSEDKIHFNIKKLETVIGYNNNDKSGLKIWNLIQNPNFEVLDNLYPQTLHDFLKVRNLFPIAG